MVMDASAVVELLLQTPVAASMAEEILLSPSDLPLVRHSHELLLDRAWELRDNLTIYDGVYVALAELLDMPLLTRDRRIAAAPGHGVTVRVIS